MRRNRTIAALALMALAAIGGPAAAATAEGPRKTIAVGGFESAESMGGSATADGLSAQLVSALLKDGRFVVVEREAMTQVQWEQQLAQSGAPGTAQGQLVGAGILVRGTVTKFDANSGGGGFAVGGFNFGGGISEHVATVEISLRLIDTATGQILSSSAASGTASSTGFDTTLYTRNGYAIGGNAFAATPLGKACEQAIANAVDQINLGMEHVPWSSLIIGTNADQIYIAAGANQNMQVGTKLQVYRKVRDLTDPATGTILETVTAPVATLQVTDVHDKISIATLQSGTTPIRGDIVKLN